MNDMFFDCGNFENIDISRFDISQVTDMGYLIYSFSNFKSLDLSNFGTSSVTNISNKVSFYYHIYPNSMKKTRAINVTKYMKIIIHLFS